MVEKYNRTFLELKRNYTLKAKQLLKEYNQTYREIAQRYNIEYKRLVKMANDTWIMAKSRFGNVSLEKLRQALPHYVQIKKGSIVLIIPHPMKIEGDIKTLTLSTVQKVRKLKHLSGQVMNITRRAVNMTKVMGLKVNPRSFLLANCL